MEKFEFQSGSNTGAVARKIIGFISSDNFTPATFFIELESFSKTQFGKEVASKIKEKRFSESISEPEVFLLLLISILDKDFPLFEELLPKTLEPGNFDNEISSTKSIFSTLFDNNLKGLYEFFIDHFNKTSFEKTIRSLDLLARHFDLTIELKNLHAMALAHHGRIDDAIDSFTTISRTQPSTQSFFNLGTIYEFTGDLGSAAAAFEESLKFDKTFLPAMSKLAFIFLSQNKFSDAENHYKDILAISPSDENSLLNLGVCSEKQEKTDLAFKLYKKCLAVNPNNKLANFNLAILERHRGNKKKALEKFKTVLTLDDEMVEAHRNLTLIKDYPGKEQHLEHLLELNSRQKFEGLEFAQLNFAIFNLADDLNKTDVAIKALIAANSKMAQLRPYSPSFEAALFDILKKKFDRTQYYDDNSQNLDETFPIPIFIVGLPRSGTTLIEQILSSHSRITGLGELHYIQNHVSKFNLLRDDQFQDMCESAHSAYMSKIDNHKIQTKYFVDKMPLNFRFIGLIHNFFPKFKIVHITRDRVMNSFSLFKSYFAEPGNEFCYDWKSIEEYYDRYKDLMSFWKSRFSEKIIEINYDSVVQDFDKEIECLFRFLNLDYENRCKVFYETKRLVKTASTEQIREPITKTDVERYELYVRKIHQLLNFK